ncbi:similar to Saccharomyces cerevisiae YER145C FTR1 High affinity iron permease involved in the transport of iron across the plasma membrane [Maudiozyma barnettii]|uniref:Similar to Saccharomyces cerevisiae YER145C FTR1 High affinity iron permease involved in the transport of iron across the plasma membrane n=1 Tax=Maudiozyma barnettii TaxID=61262 RepID=A0A8H2VHF7_9SACH|nr:high-affinity iron permease FTR1 [Kazachstania barnettii]CAB4255526.1 similar to Saccharomyces cerevisiae YER145C FTR1 High affinity iron permease involved in the transport of iron across the plasma membrane [Kazachstania barnettii]CAD1784025.1 similar to Saccharomyces cerevisiae YER145C FTR1 High affinity iron permease involved in the transport of iron across the plasma membrane [Kazachstania barnettii]
MVNKVFSVAVFFVVFRECLEAVVIISVLLSFLDQSIGTRDLALFKKLKKQVWIGVGVGFVICLAIGCGFIGAYYSLQKDIFGSAEDLWEGIFCMIATVMITMMGIPMLRMNKMQSKWRVKIAKSLVDIPKRKRDRFKLSYLTSRYAMFLLPFITVLREGLEAVVFVAGAGITTKGSQASAYPLPVFVGLLAGGFVGWLLYFGASRSSLQVFLIISTSILYLISAGLFSRGAWFFENYRFNVKTGGDASEGGDGNGSYNIKQAVYHVNCCNPELDNGWDIFNALLGWQNTGYLSSVLCYNIYWVVLISILGLMIYEEKKGHLPFFRQLHLRQLNPGYWLKNKKKDEMTQEQTENLFHNLEKLQFNENGAIDLTAHQQNEEGADEFGSSSQQPFDSTDKKQTVEDHTLQIQETNERSI